MDVRDAYAAKVGTYSLLAALILQALADTRDRAPGDRASSATPEDQNRFAMLVDLLRQALRAAIPLREFEARQAVTVAQYSGTAPNIGLASSLREDFETYDFVKDLVDVGDDPTTVIAWVETAIGVLETLQKEGLDSVLGDEKQRGFLDEQLVPFLERLANFSRDVLYEKAEGFDFV